MTTAAPPVSENVFADYKVEAYPIRYRGRLLIGTIAGGVPSDETKIEGWIKSKFADRDDLIRELVTQTMVEREVEEAEAIDEVAKAQNLNGFKRLDGGLFIEGRQLKAALKEAGSIAVAANKLPARGWGKTNKGIKSFLAEHVFIEEERLMLNVDEPSGVNQRFVHTFRGNGIQYEEYVSDAEIEFTVATDQDLDEREWAMLWLTAGQNGLGAARSQGYGRFEVVQWERLSD